MTDNQRFPFSERTDVLGFSNILPYLPLSLTYGDTVLEATALLDTGASVNILPYDIGLKLGAVWEEQTVPILLSGNLAQAEARGLVLSAKIAEFPSVLLAFAWTKSEETPLILGQTNFFETFDVCFYRADLAYELRFSDKNAVP